jgi:hypothetical protein
MGKGLPILLTILVWHRGVFLAERCAQFAQKMDGRYYIMTEMIGVRWLTDDGLKRDALLYHKIAYILEPGSPLSDIYFNELNYREAFCPKRIKDFHPYYDSMIDYLLEKGVIYDARSQLSQKISKMKIDEGFRDILGLALIGQKLSLECEDIIDHFGEELVPRAFQGDPECLSFLKKFTFSNNFYTRVCSKILNYRTTGATAFPIVNDVNSQLATSNITHHYQQDVIEIVLQSLPVPDETISWEEIIDFRADPESYNRFIELQNWMFEVARGDLTPIEIEQKIEYLLHQYRKHMELHKMKYRNGILQTVVSAPFDLIENFKFGDAARQLFSLKQNKIDLLEGELNAPGREMSYIQLANDRFGK